jgi:hypothetical protein
VRLNTDVDIHQIRPEAVAGMLVADAVFRSLGWELFITSVKDGQHLARSLHYEGLAFDCCTIRQGIDAQHAQEIAAKLRAWLGPQFDVVVEPDVMLRAT